MFVLTSTCLVHFSCRMQKNIEMEITIFYFFFRKMSENYSSSAFGSRAERGVMMVNTGHNDIVESDKT